MKLSLAMIVKNEEEKLARCLDSVKDYVDEIVIADTGSTDRTREIASAYGAEIFDFEWCNDFSAARNFCIEKTTGDFVLMMDADYVMLKFPKDYILDFMKTKKMCGLAEINNYYVENGEKTNRISLSGILFPREARYVSAIHERISPDYPRAKLPISIYHDGYDNRDASKFKRNIGILEQELSTRKDPYLTYKLAQEYKGLGEAKKADELFRDAYRETERSRPYFPNIVTEYLSHLKFQNKYEEALALIGSEEKNFTDFPEFYFMCGEFYLNLVLSNPQKYIQYFGKIKESYEKCISIGENTKYQGVVGMGTFLPLHNLGAFYEVTGNIDKAKACYQAAMDIGYAQSEKRYREISKAK
jgi:glycosyltransferase involved in cell wall biosynthesis